MTKKPKKNMDEVSKNFEEFAKKNALNKNNKESFEKVVKKSVNKGNSKES